MGVLIDTSVWSLALRKKEKSNPERAILEKLIRDGLVKIIGPIRQELLSGISKKRQFTRLKKNLSYFTDLGLTSLDFSWQLNFTIFVESEEYKAHKPIS